jgi:hypothetical protein
MSSTRRRKSSRVATDRAIFFYLELGAAAADEVERTGYDNCDHDENHVEHRVPFLEVLST